MKILGKNASSNIVQLEEGDHVQLLVPASFGRTCVYLSVIDGKLSITGGPDVVHEIKGRGMRDKFRE